VITLGFANAMEALAMTGIFINYRSDDSGFAAALIDARLRTEFGDDRVFRDARSVGPATDFPPELERRLRESTVLLALIGPQWLSLTASGGSRRIDSPADYVRRELREAFRQNKHVLPVLLDHARLPRAEELPADIAQLPDRQALHVRHRYDGSDLDRLVAELARHIPRAGVTTTPAGGAGSSGVNISGHDQTFNGPIAGRDVVWK
jgi:TIR domain